MCFMFVGCVCVGRKMVQDTAKAGTGGSSVDGRVNDQKDLRALADCRLVSLQVKGECVVVGSEDVAERLVERGWAKEFVEDGSIDYSTYFCVPTELGMELRGRYRSERDRVGYEGYEVTPTRFIAEVVREFEE